MSDFYLSEPSLENNWRGIVLFGSNTASYKFALAKSLLALHNTEHDLIRLDELAPLFAHHICQHLQQNPKQGTAATSKFLTACQQFIQNNITEDQLIQQTIKLGFKDVINAFHIVNKREIDYRFFSDERKQGNKGIRLTDNFFKLIQSDQFLSLEDEAEARWRLVETAWNAGISRNLLSIQFDNKSNGLFTVAQDRRIDITSSRDCLNGYQKGRCFYCFDHISTEKHALHLADVDHFIPWASRSAVTNINGLWNLVLACQQCNRHEKSAQLPDLDFLARLYRRNEYFIDSHLPIRETLIQQTGNTEPNRRQFLQKQHASAHQLLLHIWQRPEQRGTAIF